VVPSTAGIAGGLSTESAEQPNATDRPFQQSSPPDGSMQATTSRLEVIRQQQQAAGISEEASRLLAAGWSKGTNTTYCIRVHGNGWLAGVMNGNLILFLAPSNSSLSS